MKCILVTTDFSPSSQSTLDQVLDQLYQSDLTAKVFLLNTYLVNETDPERALDMNDKLKQRSRELLAQEVNRVSKMLRPGKVDIEAITHMGSLSNVIATLIKVREIDFVAMPKEGGKYVELIAPIAKANA